MYKYFVVDTEGLATYFNTMEKVAQYLGVLEDEARIAFELGTEIVEHTIDEIIVR